MLLVVKNKFISKNGASQSLVMTSMGVVKLSSHSDFF